jgi:osmotically-inducible protein OsmY
MMTKSLCALTGSIILLTSLAGCSVFQKFQECGLLAECPGDAKITAEVEKRLREHPATQLPNLIYVSTFNDVVYLSGDVDTRSAKDDADLIARETPGVAHVVNTIVGQIP